MHNCVKPAVLEAGCSVQQWKKSSLSLRQDVWQHDVVDGVHCLIMHSYNLRFRINALPTWLTGVKYDAEKEEKYLQDNKQKELARIEEALQKAAEKGTELMMQISIGIWGLKLCCERKVLVSHWLNKFCFFRHLANLTTMLWKIFLL